MQAERKISIQPCAVALVRTKRQVCSQKAQKSADLLQLFNSNGIMLPAPTWVLLTSHQRMAGKFGGGVTSAQMATFTAGRPLLPTGAMAVVALSVAGSKCASTTPWPPRLPRWQLSGTMQQMLVLLTMWWHTAIIQSGGSVRSVATHGVHHPTNGSAKGKLAAHSVLIIERPKRGSGTQPLQSVKTLKAKRAWQNGTMNAMQPARTFLTTPACTATSRSSGSATSAQRGRSTAGLQGLIIDVAKQSQAVPSVPGTLLADATPCKRYTCRSSRVGLCQDAKPT